MISNYLTLRRRYTPNGWRPRRQGLSCATEDARLALLLDERRQSRRDDRITALRDVLIPQRRRRRGMA